MTDELRFDGRVAVVTGAGRGIGREHALLLAARGAAVVVNDFGGEVDGAGSGSARPADEVVDAIRAAGGTAIASYESVAAATGPEAIVATAVDELGRLDIVVNNAGIIVSGLLAEHTRDDFQRLFEVHVLGTLGITQAAWPHFLGASYGRVVNTASPVVAGMAGLSGYSTMKGAILSLTLTLALEGADHGIHANVLAPSAWSRMGSSMDERFFAAERALEMQATRDPRLVAPVAAYLAHESCSLNGEVLYAGGGDVGRYTIERARGFSYPELTIEDVAASIGDLVVDPA